MTGAVRTPRRCDALPGPATSVLAVIRRDWADHRLFRVPFVLDLVFGTINLAVFLLVTRWLAGPQAVIHFHYVAVGLAFLLGLQGAVHQTMQRIAREQRVGTLEFQVASGVRPWAILGGPAVLPAGVGQLRMLLYLALAVLLMGLRVDRADRAGVVVMVVLVGALCIGIATALAAIALAVPGGATAGRVVVAALGLVSGVFVPLDQLPAVLAAVGAWLPTSIALDGLRLVFGGAAWGPTALLLAGWVLVMGLVAVAVSVAALRVARRRGVLVPA